MLGITDNGYKLLNQPQPAVSTAIDLDIHSYQSIAELTVQLHQLSNQQAMP